MKSNIVSDDDILEACRASKSMREAYLTLGVAPTTFRRKAKKLGCYQPNQGNKGGHRQRVENIKLDDILTGQYPEYQTYKLKIRLLKAGIKEDKCERCGWNNKPEGAKYSPCELHHIDGNHHNHKLDNLIILCPNCHSLTKNYRFRKRNK